MRPALHLLILGVFLSVSFLIIVSDNGAGLVFSTSQSGNWNYAPVWGGAGVPGQDDIAISMKSPHSIGTIVATVRTAIKAAFSATGGYGIASLEWWVENVFKIPWFIVLSRTITFIGAYSIVTVRGMQRAMERHKENDNKKQRRRRRK